MMGRRFRIVLKQPGKKVMVESMEAIWQKLKIYDAGGKVLNNIKSMHVETIISAKQR